MMRSISRALFTFSLLASFLLNTPLMAQLISVKTVPLATGDQFLLLPAQNLGMGEVSIARADAWQDPFVNPALGIRVPESLFISLPTFYSVTGNSGSGRTLPMAVLLRPQKWFGGLLLSIQQLSPADVGGFQPALSQQFTQNLYASGYLGKRLSPENAVGVGFFWGGLNGMGGVEMLYPGSKTIDQYGNLFDLRLGFAHHGPDNRMVEALILYNSISMTHKVEYAPWIRTWEGVSTNNTATSVETNYDRTRTLGFHFGFRQPISHSPWTVGGIFTFNWKTHPKIPNYDLMRIPRDPGNTWAYNFGVGFAKETGATTFALDLIYEPIWSNTWAEAQETIATNDGRMIYEGEKTVENTFKFTNAVVKIGGTILDDKGILDFQYGLQVRLVDYNMEQQRYVEGYRRTQRERWLEWTYSLGLILNLQDLQIRYTARLIRGTGRPGIAGGVEFATRVSAADNNIIIAPRGRLALQQETVLTHRITIAMPIP